MFIQTQENTNHHISPPKRAIF